MTSPKNLGPQFMPITQLRSLKANDFSSDQYRTSFLTHRNLLTGEQPEHRDITVGELTRDHPIYQYQAKNHSFDWDRLSQDVADHGLQHPLHVGISPEGQSDEEPRLLNGHHRAIMAMEQGHMFVPWSSNPSGNGPGNEANKGYRTIHPTPLRRTWEPLINEHEAQVESQHKGPSAPPPGQGVLFNDKRNRG